MDEIKIKKLAVEYFNKTWDLIDKLDRSKEEDLMMIDYAFKSKYYWEKVGEPVNFVRSDWQVSRVFCEAKLLEAAEIYSTSCLQKTLENNITGFDLFFAYESNARVYHLMKDYDRRDEMIKKAKESIDFIEKEEDKAYCLSEINKINSL